MRFGRHILFCLTFNLTTVARQNFWLLRVLEEGCCLVWHLSFVVERRITMLNLPCHGGMRETTGAGKGRRALEWEIPLIA